MSLHEKKARSRWYSTETITDADYVNDMVLFVNTPTWAESLLHSLEQESGGFGLHVNADKMEYMCFYQKGDISTLNGSSLKQVDVFTYLKSSGSSTENDMKIWLMKAWTATNRLSITWKSDLSDKIQAAVPSSQLEL